MRYVYIALVVLITAAILTFKAQNISTVTVSFMAASVTLPLSFLVVGVYFLGMFTGALVVKGLRHLISAARTSETEERSQG